MRWSVWIRFLALLVWLPATSHCRLAALPALNFLACAHDHATTDHHASEDADSCESVESGTYRTEESFQLSGAPGSLSDSFLANADRSLVDRKIPVPEGAGEYDPPPTLPWQFLARATGCPRAPSPAS